MRTLPCLVLLLLAACDSQKSGDTGDVQDLDGDGYVRSVDCDDRKGDVHPGADETCDGLDNDCDGEVDEQDAVDAATWHADADSDGYGDATSTTSACSLPSGFVADATDCDDGDAAVHPGADEYCDGTEHDCDGLTDEDSSADATTWYLDADGDGYGEASDSLTACESPTGYAEDPTDCDDAGATINPGATEVWDGDDEDCDGEDLWAVDVAAGDMFSLALMEDGTVWAWGYNVHGELGDGTTTDRSVPVQVTALSDVVAISANYYHSLALLADGTVMAWGRNDTGQLGDGTTTDRSTPISVGALTDVVAISTGWRDSAAVLADGSLYTWGESTPWPSWTTAPSGPGARATTASSVSAPRASCRTPPSRSLHELSGTATPRQAAAEAGAPGALRRDSQSDVSVVEVRVRRAG